jgi:hypothetical protein
LIEALRLIQFELETADAYTVSDICSKWEMVGKWYA